jgi:hypothetical protein
MAHLSLDIPNSEDLKLLLQLAERLQIRVIEKTHPSIRPLKNSLKIEQMRSAQGYLGLDAEKLQSLVKELDIKEPIEDLLSQLKK